MNTATTEQSGIAEPRAVNTRWILIALGLTIVSIGGLFGLHAYQMGRHAHAFLREAERSESEEKYGEAIGFLQRYLAVVPNDAAALARLGNAMNETRQLKSALLTYERVLRLDPANDEVRRKLITIAVNPRVGRYQDAREHLDVLDPIRSSEKGEDQKPAEVDGELRELRAICQVGLGDYTAAVRSFKEATAAAPERLDAHQYLAEVYVTHLERPGDGLAQLDVMVEKNPENYEAYVARGQFFMRHKQEPTIHTRLRETRFKRPQDAPPADDADTDAIPTGAELVLQAALQDAERAVSLSTENVDVIMFAANVAVLSGHIDQAEKYAQQALTLDEANALPYMTLAQIESQQQNREGAIAWLKRGEKSAKHPEDLQWNLASFLIDMGDLKEAALTIAELRDSTYPKPRIDYLEARILFEQKEWLKAQQLYSNLRNSLADWPEMIKDVDLRLGDCYEQLRNSDQQLAAYRRALNADPTWVPARAGLARALLQVGRVEESLEQFRNISRLPGAPQEMPLQVLRLMILANMRKETGERQWQEVEAAIDRLETSQTEDSDGLSVLKAEVLFAQGQTDQAKKVLRAARESEKAKLPAWAAAISLAQRERDWTTLETLLKEAAERFGDSVELRLLRAQYVAMRFGKESSKQLQEIGTAPAEMSPDDRIRLESGLARLALAIQDFDYCEELCQSVAKQDPNNLRIRLLLFDFAIRSERESAMVQMLDEMKRIEGEGPLWRYGESVRLMVNARKQKKPELYTDALKHLAMAQIARPGWSRVPLLTAEIHDAQGKPDAAIPDYLRAIELGERAPNTIRRTVQLLRERGRFVEADQTIRRLQDQQSPFSSELTRMASEVSVRLEEFDRALEFAEETAASSDNHRDHMWLGQILENLDRHEEAEAALRQAKSLNSGAPEVWIALIHFLQRQKRTEAVEQELAQMETHLNPEDAPMAMAQLYDSLNRLEEAEQRYQEAAKQSPENPAVLRAIADFYVRHGAAKKSEPYLNQLTTGPLEVSEADRAWANRNLAILVAGDAGYQNYQRSVKMLDQNLESASASIDDRRAKAYVLSTQPTKKTHREAIKILNELLEESTQPNPNDQLLLANLYLADGNWGKANGLLRNLASLQTKSTRFKERYARVLLAQQEINEAELWIRQLERLAPDEPATIELRSKALLFREKHDDVVAVFQRYVEALDPASAELPTRSLWAAAHLERIGWVQKNSGEEAGSARYFEESEKLFRKYSELRPEGRLNLAAFEARHGDVDSALEAVEQVLETAPPQDLAKTFMELVSPKMPSPSQLQRLDAALDRALERRERPMPLVIAAAGIRNQEARYDEAVALYREVLETDADNVTAMNNLAMLLALTGGDADEAIAMLNQALKIAGPKAPLLDSRATAYLAKHQGDAARKDLEAAINEQPTAARYFRLAQAYLLTGNMAKAEAAIKEAKKLGLKEEALHPLERPDYGRVIAMLASVTATTTSPKTRAEAVQ